MTAKGSGYSLVVIGVSAGGMEALPKVLGPLPADFNAPVLVVQHMDPGSQHGFLAEHLDRNTALKVTEAIEREKVLPGHVYISPANYHLLLEADWTLALSVDEKVNYSRPSIDVLFESAALACGRSLIGVILTGASADGAMGLKAIKEKGGLTVVQDPKTAMIDVMPLSAIRACRPHCILSLENIARFLIRKTTSPKNE